MKIKLWIAIGMLTVLACLAGCNNSQKTNTLPEAEKNTPAVTVAAEETMAPTVTSTPTPSPTNTPTPTPTPVPLEKVIFSEQEFFYAESLSVELNFDTATEGIIYYTLDGTVPTEASLLYEEPLLLEASEEDSPNIYHLRADAMYPDGTMSGMTAHTFFVGEKGSANEVQCI